MRRQRRAFDSEADRRVAQPLFVPNNKFNDFTMRYDLKMETSLAESFERHICIRKHFTDSLVLAHADPSSSDKIRHELPTSNFMRQNDGDYEYITDNFHLTPL